MSLLLRVSGKRFKGIASGTPAFDKADAKRRSSTSA
jgi:hypothetical protein